MLASPPPETEPTTEPLVFGAMGHFQPRVVETACVGLSLDTQVRNPSLWLLSEAPLASWQSRDAQGLYWGQLNQCSAPDSMTSVQRDCGAPGVVYTRSTVHLHGDLLGVRPLYFMRIDNAIYFSNRFEVILKSCRRANLDPYAWAAMVSLWFAPPGVSIVKEISTLRLGEVIGYDTETRQFSAETRDIEIDVEPKAATGDLFDAIGATFDSSSEHTLLLSGGFDSRLLLACAVRSDIQTATVTTSKDDGSDVEVGFARDTAEALGVSHRVVEEPEGMWHHWFEEATERMAHGTPHHAWAVPMARHIRESREPAAFGFGGGLVLNSHMQEPANDGKGTDVDARLHLLRRMGARVFDVEPLLSEKIMTDQSERIQTEFLDRTSQFAERRDWQALSLLSTRTARSIALLATRLVGPRLRVLTPYLSPSVLRFALSPTIHGRRSNELYRELLTQLGIDDLPATSDLPPLKPRDQAKRQSTDGTVRWMARTIADDDIALGVFHPDVRRRIVESDVADLKKLFQPAAAQKVVQGVLMLALFRRRHPAVGGHIA